MSASRLLLLFAFAVTAHAELTLGVPAIELKPKPEDEEVETTFKFRNNGEKTVKILSLESACSCLSSELDKAEYKPAFAGQTRAPALTTDTKFEVKQVTKAGDFKTPFAVEFLPGGKFLVTERQAGQFRIIDKDGKVSPPIKDGVPAVMSLARIDDARWLVVGGGVGCGVGAGGGGRGGA